MKVLHLSTSDIDGGAARAAYRLHRGLQKIGLDSQMLVRDRQSADKTVISGKTKIAQLGANLDGLPLGLYSCNSTFSTQWFPDRIDPKVAQLRPDIINLHWLCGGYIQIETIAKFAQPLIWTLHDMWAFTGGCHYSEDCDRYAASCGSCPQLHSSKNWDLSHWVWQRKAAWKKLNLTIVAPSSWLAECAKSSSLFKDVRVEVIPHGLDLETYQPIDQFTARQLLKLPQDKQLVLFGATGGAASDSRKGFGFLHQALKKLSESGWKEKLELVIFGSSQSERSVNLGFKTHYLGRLYDNIGLALTYSAADVIIVPSVQEAFGQTASESLACGTPVVAFSATGLKDIVDHQQNGYLASPFNIEDLARGIGWVLEDGERYKKLRYYAREKAEQEFSLELQARRYSFLFTDMVKREH